jgi:hypothetical protein
MDAADTFRSAKPPELPLAKLEKRVLRLEVITIATLVQMTLALIKLFSQ